MILNPIYMAFSSGLIIGAILAAGAMSMLLVPRRKKPPYELDITTTFFLEDVRKEIIRARNKFPSNAHLLAALTEEVGELNKAYLDGESDNNKYSEAMQVACVAARVATEKDGDFS